MPIPHNYSAPTAVEPELTLRFSTYVKNACVLALREAFAHPSTPAEYRYVRPAHPGQETLTLQTEPRTAIRSSQISIYRAFPNRTVKYPCIIVETSEGDASIQTLGNEEGYPKCDPLDPNKQIGVVYTGIMRIPVKITIYADTPTDRERLTDLVTIFFRFVFRHLFYREQMPYLDIRAGETGTEERGDKVRFTGEVNLQVQTEFDQYIDNSLLQAISAIKLDMKVGSKPADLQSIYED